MLKLPICVWIKTLVYAAGHGSLKFAENIWLYLMCVCSKFQFTLFLVMMYFTCVDVLISINSAAPKLHPHLIGCGWDEVACVTVALFLKCHGSFKMRLL